MREEKWEKRGKTEVLDAEDERQRDRARVGECRHRSL